MTLASGDALTSPPVGPQDQPTAGPGEPMTPTQLRKALITLGWPAIELRRRLNASDQTIWRWSRGIYPIPHAVADWLTARVRYEKAAPPPPENWTKTPGRKPK